MALEPGHFSDISFKTLSNRRRSRGRGGWTIEIHWTVTPFVWRLACWPPPLLAWVPLLFREPVPTQVGTLTPVVTSVHLGRPAWTPIFMLTHLMPFSTRLRTQCFKMRLEMVVLLSAVNQILEWFSKNLNSNKLFISCLVWLWNYQQCYQESHGPRRLGMPPTSWVNF